MSMMSFFLGKARKGRLRAAGLMLLALAGSGCNGDVFIDEFMPGDPPSISIGRAGETVTVPFEADNWGVRYFEDLGYGFSTQCTDGDGNGFHLPMEEGQTGTVRIYNEFFDLEAVRCSGRELELTLRENLYDNPVEFGLAVGNLYEEKLISLRLAPGSKYRVDSVAYDWSQFFTYDYKAEWVYSIRVDNTMGTDTIWPTIRPYEGAVRSVRFFIPGSVMPAGYYATILGNPLPEVVIPDVEGGQPVLRDTRAFFWLTDQDLPSDLDETFAVRVPVPGGKYMEVGVYVTVENYTVPFTLHCSNPDNGRTRAFSGTLTSDRPYDYFYIRTDLTHTDE